MQGYWESSVRYFMEKEKRWHHKRLEDKEVKPKNKFKIGDTVYVKGRVGEFVVERWIFESSCNSDKGVIESSYYDLKGKTNNSYLDFVDEEDIDRVPVPSIKVEERVIVQVTPKTKLTKTDIDNLLDQYNEFTELHNFLNSIGVLDDQYRQRAEGIMSFLKK